MQDGIITGGMGGSSSTIKLISNIVKNRAAKKEDDNEFNSLSKVEQDKMLSNLTEIMNELKPPPIEGELNSSGVVKQGYEPLSLSIANLTPAAREALTAESKAFGESSAILPSLMEQLRRPEFNATQLPEVWDQVTPRTSPTEAAPRSLTPYAQKIRDLQQGVLGEQMSKPQNEMFAPRLQQGLNDMVNPIRDALGMRPRQALTKGDVGLLASIVAQNIEPRNPVHAQHIAEAQSRTQALTPEATYQAAIKRMMDESKVKESATSAEYADVQLAELYKKSGLDPSPYSALDVTQQKKVFGLSGAHRAVVAGEAGFGSNDFSVDPETNTFTWNEMPTGGKVQHYLNTALQWKDKYPPKDLDPEGMSMYDDANASSAVSLIPNMFVQESGDKSNPTIDKDDNPYLLNMVTGMVKAEDAADVQKIEFVTTKNSDKYIIRPYTYGPDSTPQNPTYVPLYKVGTEDIKTAKQLNDWMTQLYKKY